MKTVLVLNPYPLIDSRDGVKECFSKHKLAQPIHSCNSEVQRTISTSDSIGIFTLLVVEVISLISCNFNVQCLILQNL